MKKIVCDRCGNETGSEFWTVSCTKRCVNSAGGGLKSTAHMLEEISFGKKCHDLCPWCFTELFEVEIGGGNCIDCLNSATSASGESRVCLALYKDDGGPVVPDSGFCHLFTPNDQ